MLNLLVLHITSMFTSPSVTIFINVLQQYIHSRYTWWLSIRLKLDVSSSSGSLVITIIMESKNTSNIEATSVGVISYSIIILH